MLNFVFGPYAVVSAVLVCRIAFYATERAVSGDWCLSVASGISSFSIPSNCEYQ